MKTASYNLGRRWRRASATRQQLLADQIAFELRCAAAYGY